LNNHISLLRRVGKAPAVIRVAAFVFGGKVGRYYGHYSILRVSFTYGAPNITA